MKWCQYVVKVPKTPKSHPASPHLLLPSRRPHLHLSQRQEKLLLVLDFILSFVILPVMLTSSGMIAKRTRFFFKIQVGRFFSVLGFWGFFRLDQFLSKGPT